MRTLKHSVVIPNPMMPIVKYLLGQTACRQALGRPKRMAAIGIPRGGRQESGFCNERLMRTSKMGAEFT